MDAGKLKEMGRKARERLQEERNKRKEIVRINEKELEATAAAMISKSRSPSNFSKAVKQTQKKRKVNKTKQASLKRKRANSPLTELNQSEDVDEWMPSTQHLFNSSEGKDEIQHSNTVRIHGFPICGNERHLKKFFTGLSLEQIFTIPAFEKSIQNFDVKDDLRHSSVLTKGSSKRFSGSKKIIVERHRATVRIFCKFKSTSAAQAAIQRSGEILFYDDDYGNIHAGAAIAVVPVSKSIALHLTRNMAFVWMKGQDLNTLMEVAEKEVPIHVRQILWVMLAQKMKTDLDMTIYMEEQFDDGTVSDHEGISCQELLEYGHHWNPRNLAILHNKLLDLYETLKTHYPLLMSQFDPSMPLLPSNYLRCFYAVSHWLLREMNVIENCLFQSKGTAKIVM